MSDDHSHHASSSLLPPRFSQVELLGEGAFGSVFRAIDDMGRTVAVKVLDATLAVQPDVAWQFGGEFARLARLEHPAFPTAYEEGRTLGGLPFYSMALVEGMPLDEAGPLPSATVRTYMADLAEALAYLHERGWIHGDLKPENMLQAPGNRLALLDVGMMAPVGRPRETISGSLEYMGPEVFRKAPIDPSADLYALGACAYQFLTGRPPFTGLPADILRGHLQVLPVAPSMRGGEPDALLEPLVLALLAKDPTNRPTLSEVLAALGRPASASLSRRARLQLGEFVGRDEILASWTEEVVRPDAAGVHVLIGASGMGKSRLLDELRQVAQLHGKPFIAVASTGASDAPGAMGRSILSQALVLAKLSAPPIAESWLAGLPSPLLESLEVAARKLALYDSASRALSDAAKVLGGIAIGVDDWNQADSATRDFVRHALRNVNASIVWVFTGCPTADEKIFPTGKRHVIPPLGEDEASRLIASRLGVNATSSGLLERLLPLAIGSPRVIELMLEYLVERGALLYEDSHWNIDPDTPLTGIPLGIYEAWKPRLALLESGPRALAVAAAIAMPAGSLPLPVLAAGTGLSGDLLIQAQDQLLQTGWLSMKDGQGRLAIAELAGLLLQDEPANAVASRAEAMVRTFIAFAGQAVDLEVWPLDRLIQAARLAFVSHQDALALSLGLAAGRRGLAMAAPADALPLLVAAGERISGDVSLQERLALAFCRAEAERFLDRHADARRSYTEATALADTLGDIETGALAWIGLGKCEQLGGDYMASLAAYTHAITLADRANAPALAARALASAGRVYAFRGENGQAIEAATRASTLATDVPAVKAQALTLRGYLTVQDDLADADAGLALLDEALTISRRLGDRMGEGAALENIGNARLALGDLAAAAEAFSAYAAVCREAGLETEALFADLNTSLVAVERGEISRASKLAADVAMRSRASNRRFPLALARAIEGQAAWRAGRPAEALEALADALVVTEAIKNKLLEEHVRAQRLEAWIALGDQAAAYEELARAEALVQVSGNAEMVPRLGGSAAELALQSGDFEQALALALPWLTSPNRVAAHQALRVAGGAALALGRPIEALEHGRAALTIAQGWQSVWHQAADKCLLARMLSLRGERALAAELAREVLNFLPEETSPYARLFAAQLLADQGEREGAEAFDALLSKLRPSLAALGHDRALALLAAQGLTAAEGLLERRESTGQFSALDPARITTILRDLSLEEEEAGIGQTVLNATVELVGADRGYMLCYEGGRLRRVFTHGMDYTTHVEPAFSHSIAEHVLLSGDPIYLTDASNDEQWSETKSVMALGLRTVIALPVATANRTLGVLYLEREAIDPLLLSGDMALLDGLATAAASAILCARRVKALELELARSRAREALGLALTKARSVQAWRTKVISAALAATAAERGFWLTLAADGSIGEGIALDVQGRAVPFQRDLVSDGIIRLVGERHKAVALVDTEGLDGWRDRRSVQALELRTVWCVPAGPQALLYIQNSHTHVGDPNESLATLESLVAYALLQLPSLS